MASPSHFSFGQSSSDSISYSSRESIESSSEKMDKGLREEKKERSDIAKKSSMEIPLETKVADKPKKVVDHSGDKSNNHSGEKVLKGFYAVAAAPLLAVGAVKNAAKDAFKNKDIDVKDAHDVKEKKDKEVPEKRRITIEAKEISPHSSVPAPSKSNEKRRTIDFKRKSSGINEKEIQAQFKKMQLEEKLAQQLEMRHAYQTIIGNETYLKEYTTLHGHTDLIILQAEGESGSSAQINKAKETAKNFLMSKGAIEKKVRLSPFSDP